MSKVQILLQADEILCRITTCPLKQKGIHYLLLLLLLLFAPNVKGECVDSNFQIIDLLVQPRGAGVAGTLIFVHIANFATLQP